MTLERDIDPRWPRLQTLDFVCASCGQRHAGLFAMATLGPDCWRGASDPPAGAGDAELQDVLTSDFCIVGGEHFFVRCNLLLPIAGSGGRSLDFGVWSSLSKANFRTYADAYEGQRQGGLGPWFGWLSNRLPGYPDTRTLKCSVRPQDGGVRPLLELEPTDHPLAVDQRDGVSIDRMLDIYAACGHDFRSALGSSV